MKRNAWLLSFLVMTALAALAGCANRQKVATRSVQAQSVTAESAQSRNIRWTNSTEYEDYMVIFNEKDSVKQAAGSERYLTNHKDTNPQILTAVYSMMFRAYANTSNWAKVIETYDRIGLATRLTDSEKKQFAQIAEYARIELQRTS